MDNTETSFWAQLLQLLHPFSCAQSGLSPPHYSPSRAGEFSLTFFGDLLLCSYLFSAVYFKTLFFLFSNGTFAVSHP